MRKITLSLILLLMMIAAPAEIRAGTARAVLNETTIATEKSESDMLIGRLEVIRSMDKSNLSTSEKRNLRKEVRSIKSRLKTIGGGIYLSTGAVIIIIILLIILL